MERLGSCRVLAKTAKPPAWRSRAWSSPELAAALQRLGQRVRELREKGELTQEEAADGAHLSSKHWLDIQAGRTNPTLAWLIAVARSLGVPVKELVDRI